MHEAKLYKPYLNRAIVCDSGEIYLHASDALAFIAACEAQDVAILGFDTFKIDATGTRPLMDGIADFSAGEKKPWPIYRSTCNQVGAWIVEQIIEEKQLENTYFTFVVWNERDYNDNGWGTQPKNI